MNPPLSVRISLALASVSHILSLWLFDDLLYAVLSILVLATITTLLGETFHDFLQIKEWSFATIVLFGVSIRRLIRLKVQIQQTSHSSKLETGVQVYIILLIAAVLMLSFVVLIRHRSSMARRSIVHTARLIRIAFGEMDLFSLGRDPAR